MNAYILQTKRYEKTDNIQELVTDTQTQTKMVLITLKKSASIHINRKFILSGKWRRKNNVTYIHTWIHANIHTYIPYIHTCMHACIHTYIHTYICVYLHTMCNLSVLRPAECKNRFKPYEHAHFFSCAHGQT